MERLLGTYPGVVESNVDPEKLGRLKVRVPQTYGAFSNTSGYIGTDVLPWAMPSGLPGGGSSASGGMDWLPEIGDQVLVRFLDGEPEKPVWEWFMRNTKQRDGYELHVYDEITQKPDRGALTRYGHTFEFNEAGLLMTTSHGYSVLLTDSGTTPDGSIRIATQKIQFMDLDDETDTITMFGSGDYYVDLIKQIRFQSARFTVRTTNLGVDITSGAEIEIDAVKEIVANTASTMDLTAADSMSLNTLATLQAKFATLLLGEGATEPYVLGNLMVAFLNALLLYLSTHTHTNGNNGSPTGAPIQPVHSAVAEPSTLISQVIRGL